MLNFILALEVDTDVETEARQVKKFAQGHVVISGRNRLLIQATIFLALSS